MDVLGKDNVPFTNFCEWCFSVGTNRCSRCRIAYYCSKEHQIQHWNTHRKTCLKSELPISPVSVNTNTASASSVNYSAIGNWCQSNVPISNNEEINQIAMPTNAFDPYSCNVSSEKPMDFQIPNEDEILSSLTSELLSSDNNFWGLINSCDTQSISDYGIYLDKDTSNQLSGATNVNVINTFDSPCDKNSSTAEDVDIMQCASLNDICSNVVHDLNTYGICVLDNFIGTNYGNLILQEVKNLYMQGIFKKGELVNPSPYASKETIRSDVTTWVDGSEPNCKYIGNLIRKLDVVVTTCNKMTNNGLLSKYKLHRRTKAMIACYPGDGTYYKKHIDNPHRDGRCITCIYYLNQNWDTKTHGGLLRMFPAAHDSQVANIEPIFDRMIFFWSDKRNPHEVLPAYATRFAITVWYFDADERDQALKISRERSLMKSQNQPFMN